MPSWRPDDIASNSRMINEWRITRGVEGSGSGLL